MVITFPSDYSDKIDEIRDLLGRSVQINIPVSGIACAEPGCDLDPVTGLSTDQFCETCDGDYWINTTSGYSLTARVLYKTVGIPVWNPHGMLFDGDLQLRIKYSDDHLNYVETGESFVVDEKTYILKGYELRGVPDPNRIVISLIEKEG